MSGPVLFCYDGSEGSRAAMAAAAELVAHPAPAVVLTIWQSAAALLARAGGFGGTYLTNEGQIDEEQAQLAREAAEDNRQDSGGGGVKGSEMTDGALTKNSAHAVHYVVRC